MSETAKIKLNDRPENAEKPNEKVELPIVDNDKKRRTRRRRLLRLIRFSAKQGI
ncbi:hypothetical protein LRW96_001501 [Neisseria gonorrhoeae]